MYENSEFTKRVRVTEEHHEFLKSLRPEKPIAVKLKEIIEFYKRNNTNALPTQYDRNTNVSDKEHKEARRYLNLPVGNL